MTDLSKFTQLPSDFDGNVRLFPLPDLVVFPNAMQPLHIFEPRYCEMLHEALATDQLIAMATLAPQWQQANPSAVSIEPYLCICRILAHTATEDDRHNIHLVGLKRAKIIEELDTGRPFRMARVDILEDVYPSTGSSSRATLKRDLLDAFRALIPDVAVVQQNLHELMASQMPLGTVTDIIGFTMQFDRDDKLRLLSDQDVDSRAQLLLNLLAARHPDPPEAAADPLAELGRRTPFPPPFSNN